MVDLTKESKSPQLSLEQHSISLLSVTSLAVMATHSITMSWSGWAKKLRYTVALFSSSPPH